MGQFSPSLLLLAKIAAWIAVVFSLSWLVSFLAPPIVAIFGQTGTALQRLRQHVREKLLATLNSRLERFWSQQAVEPRAPITAELCRVADMVEGVGAEQVGRLEDLERRFSHGVDALHGLTINPSGQGGPSLEALQQGVRKAKESFWFSAILLVMVVAFGVTNAFLLQLFFGETLGHHALVGRFEVSHALAALMAFMEVAAGIALHFRSSEDTESGTSRVFRMAPWFAIIALMVIESVAYGVLSVNMNLASSLQIPVSSPFYAFVQYALAFFGAGITIILSALGYRLWSSWQEYLIGRRETSVLRELGSYSKSVRGAGSLLASLNAHLEEFKRSAAALKPELVKSFSSALGAPSDRRDVAGVIRAHAERFDVGGNPLENRPTIRSKSQLIADLSVNLLLLALWVVLLYLNAVGIGSYLAGQSSVAGVLTTGAGWVVAVSISLFGFLVKDARIAARHSSVTASSIPERRGRLALMYLAALGFVFGAFVNAAVATMAHTLGGIAGVNIGYGLFLALALALVSFNLDAALLAAVHAVMLALFAMAYAGLYAYICLSLVAEGILFLIGQLIRLLAVPGDLLRRRRVTVEP